MKTVFKLQRYLSENYKNSSKRDFRIPKLWKKSFGKSDKLYEYILEILDEIIKSGQKNSFDYSKPYYMTHSGGKSGNWIRDSFIYSMMIRFASAHDYNSDGKLEPRIETGSFIKSIAMLPYLSDMGIDTIYLLPVMKHSFRYKKGEAGSCYAVSDFFSFDMDLKDPACENISLELGFKAFVEVAHFFGIKIIIDIIPRTNAINSDLIEEHPDWFYWIDLDSLPDYKSPFVPKILSPSTAENKLLDKVFQSDEVINHVLKFRENPRDKNPELYKKVQKEFFNSKDKNLDFLSFIEKRFSMTVAPAFSDVINDTQPAWSDITYLRLYKDHPIESKRILDNLGLSPYPYIMFDVAKASNCFGEVPNHDLWSVLSNIIPHYQKNFGIDGVRIDMGHALPEDLLDLIIKKALEYDKNFCFIAEELNPKKSKMAKKQGYHALVGDAFFKFDNLEKAGYSEFVKTAENQPIPLFSCPETHDTPRIASKSKGKLRSKTLTLASLFIPNTVAFLNNGQELFEIQPMNLGLGAGAKDQFVLNENDPYYSKMALFDYTAMHWNKAEKENLIEDIKMLLKYRKEYYGKSIVKSLFFPVSGRENMAILHLFFKRGSCIISAINTDFKNGTGISLEIEGLLKDFGGKIRAKCLYSSKKNVRLNTINIKKGTLSFKLSAGEFSLFEILK